MKTPILLALSCLLLTTAAYAQVGIGTPMPDAQAALDIQASGKGLLIPRMDSATRAGIASPPTGLMVFQTDGRQGFWYAVSGAWLYIPDKTRSGDNLGNHTATLPVKLNGNTISNNGTGGLQFNNTGNAGLNTTADADIPLTVLAPASSFTAQTVVARHANPNIGVEFGATTDNGRRMGFGINNSGHSDPGAVYLWNYNNTALRIGTGSVERIRILGGGKVGIGTAVPQRKLHVAGGLRLDTLAGPGLRLVSASANGDLGSQTTGPDNGLFWGLTGNSSTGAVGSFIGTTDNQDFVVKANGAEAARFQASGGTRVGTGTATTNSTLQVLGTLAVGVATGIAGSAAGTALSSYAASYLALLPSPGADYYLLPSASSAPGRVYYLRNSSTGRSAYIGAGNGSGPIFDGSSTASVTTYEMQISGSSKSVTAVSDGVQWIFYRSGN